MSETNIEPSLRQRTDKVNETASLGAYRKHKPLPQKRMVKDREPTQASPESARRANRLIGGIAAGVAVASLLAAANDSRKNAEAAIEDGPKVTVDVEANDTIEKLVKDEVAASLADPRKVDEIGIQPLIDKAVEWNGGTSAIQAGDHVVIPDYPNEVGSFQFDQAMREQQALGADAVVNEQLRNNTLPPSQIP